MDAKITTRQVYKRYPSVDGGEITALEDFSLDVADGEFVCIVGPSGCGKSTFLRILAGLDTASAGSVTITPGADPRKPLNNVVFQEYAIFPWKTVLDNVAFGLEMRGVGKAEREATAREWIERVGLTKFAGYYPHQISGGMKQRVSIARALALEPKILVLDEPVSALDVSIQSQILNLLNDLQDEFKLSYLFIAHNLAVVEHFCDRVAVMYLGRIVELADRDTLYRNPIHPYTQALLSAAPRPDPHGQRRRIMLAGEVPSPIELFDQADRQTGDELVAAGVAEEAGVQVIKRSTLLEPALRGALREAEPGHWVAKEPA